MSVIVVVIVGGLLGLFIFSPWALHLGGRWTPLTQWHGYGKMHSSYGADYGLYLEVFLASHRRRHSAVPGSNLRGSAILCGPKLAAHSYDVVGTVHNVWLDVDGKRTVLHLHSDKSGPKLDFTLEGAWEGQQLNLRDRGSLAAGFNSDGSPRGVGVGMYGPTENADVTLEYGSKSEFENLCRKLGAGN